MVPGGKSSDEAAEMLEEARKSLRAEQEGLQMFVVLFSGVCCGRWLQDLNLRSCATVGTSARKSAHPALKPVTEQGL